MSASVCVFVYRYFSFYIEDTKGKLITISWFDKEQSEILGKTLCNHEHAGKRSLICVGFGENISIIGSKEEMDETSPVEVQVMEKVKEEMNEVEDEERGHEWAKGWGGGP